MRVLFRLPLFFINADQLLAAAGVLAKAVVGNSVKPCRKFRFTAKRPNVFESANESVLGQIVRQREVAPRELAQQTANGRLMTTNQLAISVLVVINENSRDKAGISELHISRLRCRRRRRNLVLLFAFQLPDQ